MISSTLLRNFLPPSDLVRVKKNKIVDSRIKLHSLLKLSSATPTHTAPGLFNFLQSTK